ncbi:MAG: AAA family ATPase [Anaerolineae bacterium]
MDLFEQAFQEHMAREAPLAARMRPRTLDEFVGQEHIIGPGRLLRRAIQADQLSSVIFYGPPGTGKTTLAMVIANTTKSHFITINAVLAGVNDIRAAIEVAQERRRLYHQRTILFVDEVHRFNKAQQDALLPWVENGTIILIGATTENPWFSVNAPLVSRSRIFQLKPLTEEDLYTIARRALSDPERGYGKRKVEMHEDALAHLVNVSNGDARSLLNALELAVETTPPNEDGGIVVDMAVAEESIQRRAVLYDKEGDYHFDTISAFIKSLRGSDPDAAMYWLAKMVYAGEDPRFIFRRMLIFAGEDVGLADPNAVAVVNACAEAFDRVGLPEGRFHLAEAALYLATAPKSNSVFAFFDALATVEQEREGEVPVHLRDASRDQEGLGHGAGYLYPHAYRDHWVAQQYLPDSLQGKVFYQPGELGYERQIRETILRRREAQLAAMVEREISPAVEHLTFSPPDRARERWVQRTLSRTSELLEERRRHIFELAGLLRHHVVLDLNAGTGLLTWEAVRRTPEGGVWCLVEKQEEADALLEQAGRLPELERPVVWKGRTWDLPRLMGQAGEPALRFDRVIGRNVFTEEPDKPALARLLAELLRPEGRIVLAEVVPRRAQRLYALVEPAALPRDLAERWKEAEEATYADAGNPMVNWDIPELESAFGKAGLDVRIEVVEESNERVLGPRHIEQWFTPASSGRPSYIQRLLASGLLTEEEMELLRQQLSRLVGRPLEWRTTVAYVAGRPAK